MNSSITYTRRSGEQLQTTTDLAELLPDWQGPRERWLFVSPHDDDIVSGGGLTFQAGIAAGVEVHALVVSDGRMGYCRPEHRQSIAAIRAGEARASFAILGLAPDRLYFLGYPDGDLSANRGRRFAAPGCPGEINGGTGLQNSFTYYLRKVRPNRVFLPSSADVHPDHRVTHEELLVSLFHAQGTIWPELGPPLSAVPYVYEFAIYCDFPEPPQLRLDTPPAMLEKKLAGITAYASQEQIETVVAIQREIGPIEYVRELNFHFYLPTQYHSLFARKT